VRDDSFRWDPIEDRRYAYQYGDPSDDSNKIGTVPGADRLAAFGFALMTSAPAGGELTSLGIFRRDGNIIFCWPLVDVPTSLAGHLALLGHPALGDEARAKELAAYGVVAVARSDRYGVRVAQAEYHNLTRARLQYLKT
jgi:hypothetical protein